MITYREGKILLILKIWQYLEKSVKAIKDLVPKTTPK